MTIELGCWARVQCKFLDLFSTNKRLHAQTALEMIQALYQVGVMLSHSPLNNVSSIANKQLSQLPNNCLHSYKPSAAPAGNGLAKATDYTLKHWQALTRYLQKPDY
jgi:hypothetical protein